MENYRINCRKSASSGILAGFGEVERATSGQPRKKTSIDWRRYVDMITIQYTEALSEVWLAAWLLTLSNTARGGRQQRNLGVLSELIGFNSRLLGKIYCVLSFSYLTMYPKDDVSAWAEVWPVDLCSTLSTFAGERVGVKGANLAEEG